MAIAPISGIIIPRQSVVGSEGLWTKMFDPPTDSPPTPENLDLTLIGLDGSPIGLPAGIRANPVPSVMAAAGFLAPIAPYTVLRTLMHGMTIDTWDKGLPGQIVDRLNYFLFAEDNLIGIFGNPQFPAPTYRAPRGVICHNTTSAQGPPPHTIHWHGIEPTPINDGVGHCSMELGTYIYQWQPNFIGTYFYHCHRNTMQHFEFGLAGLMLFNPPDAFFASIDPASVTPGSRATGVISLIPGYPIGHGRPEAAGEGGLPAAPLGRFRTAANLDFPGIPAFPGYVRGHPVQGVNVPEDPAFAGTFLGFPTNPHAYTVPYDVECLWAVDDRSSNWSINASNARDTFPAAALTVPPVVGGPPVPITGVNDQFDLNPGAHGWFNFNDFNADYWFVTGVPVRAHSPGPAPPLATNLIIPPQLNGGISGTRVDILANRGQTVFIRCLCSSYNSVRTTFPVDVVIIEWDGRALGVPPLNRYTRPVLVPAGTPIVHSTARRWGVLLNVPVTSGQVHSNVTVEFLDTRSASISLTGGGDVLMTALIPININ